ncbi:MAG: MBL fold metallo-hydrolase [Acidobacteria bacterium]|nr:MAG: MBL fold metallo-hydrolase [Acidobacteriota bacterium]
MLKKYAAVSVLACLLGAIPAIIVAQDAVAAKTLLTSVAKAMGAESLRAIQFSGMGSNSGIGQNINPKVAWPVVRVKTYIREMDFAATASHVQLVRVQGGTDQTQNEYISSDSPWDIQFKYWLSPFGFIKGAMANNASVKSETIAGSKYNVVTFTLQNKYKFVGFINDQNLVERIQTWIDNDVVGDMLVEAWYSQYKDFGGVKFPTMIVEKQAGFPVLILSVSDVKPNAAVNIQAPPAPAGTTTGTLSVQTEKVADGVFYLKGGTHHSVAVEFGDHIAVIEGPLNEQRSLAVIAEVKKLIPNTPIRYLVNTHHHFDHSGGLRTYVDEGATIVTHEINKEFYDKAFSAPRTLNPDRLARSQKKATVETVGDKKVLSDGTRTLELHLIKGNPHNDGILLAFLPKEKILIEVDVYTPAAANAAAPPAAPAVNRNTTNLVENVERLKLDFEKILPLHGPGAVTRADLYAAIGKPVPDIMAILSAKPVQVVAASPGKQLLDTICTTCHNLNRVQAKHVNLADWQTIVERMKGKGAELSDDDTSTLLDYLVKTYGPDK